MGRRLDLHEILKTFVDNVYFQPPSTIQLVFPCIVYSRYRALSEFADNEPYINTRRYQVTVIDRDPDSAILDKVASLPRCTSDRFFVADNLNHDVYNLYY